MKPFLKMAVCAVTMYMGINAVHADVYNASSVSADAKWLCHIDFDAIRNSPTSTMMWDGKEEKSKERMEAWEKKMEEMEASGEAPSDRQKRYAKHFEVRKMMMQRMEDFKKATGFDPRVDLLSCTMYGTKFEKHQGVMLLNSYLNQSKFTQHVKGLKDYQSLEDGIASFSVMADTRGEHTTYCAFHGTNTIVFSRNLDDVKASLAVLKGQTKSLATSDSDLKNGFKAGTTFAMRAVVDEGLKAKMADKKGPHVAFAQSMSGMDMWMGEANDKGFFEMRLSFDDADKVALLKQMADGGLGWISMQAKTDEGKNMLSKVKITAADKTLVIKWEATSTDIEKTIDAIAQHYKK